MSKLTFAEFVPLALRTEKPSDSKQFRHDHAFLGLFTEGGEIVSELKRNIIYEKPMTDERLKHIGEEIGDAAWYLAIGYNTDWFKTYQAEPTVFNLEPFSSQLEFVEGWIRALNDYQEATAFDEFEEALQWMQNLLIRLSKTFNLDFEELLFQNIEKLKARFPDAYTNEAAEARADKGGLSHRES